MKVLSISTVEYGNNGITQVIKNIYRSKVFKNDIVDYVFPAISKDFQLHGLNEFNLHIIDRYSNKFEYITQLHRLIHKGKYDIVHIHANSHTAALEMVIARFAGAKIIVVHAHSNSCKYKILHRVMSPLFYLTYDIGVACSQSAGAFMFGRRRFHIINNGINIEQFRFNVGERKRIRNNLGVSEDMILLGHVGYFSSFKNQMFLINMMNILESNYRLILIGDGDLKEACMQCANERILFIGSTNEVDKYLSAIDLFLLPSLFEGLGLVLVEAQASGLNCIASINVPKESNITGGVQYLPLDLTEWCDAVTDNAIFVENRERNSQSYCKMIEKGGYSSASSASSLHDMYREALNNP